MSSLDNIDLSTLHHKDNETIIPYNIIKHAILGWIEKDDIKIPVIRTDLIQRDIFGTLKIRLGFGRSTYKIPTGLYAIGKPDEHSEVIVSANYKHTFDVLRKDLNNLNLWLLILDTDGVNVWCAAGKGSFSSKELIYQLNKCNLKQWLKHRRLILPQLGAGSMEPHLVRKYSGFKVEYGPIRSKDIKEYFINNRQSDEAMRQVSFNLFERIVLIPVEIKNSLKYMGALLILLYVAHLLSPPHTELVLKLNATGIIWAFFLGTTLFPIVLPVLPFNRFSLKGWFLGLIGAITYVFLVNGALDILSLQANTLGIFMAIQLIVSILGLIFTGSTPYTSYTSVDTETRKILPYYAGLATISLLLVVFSYWR